MANDVIELGALEYEYVKKIYYCVYKFNIADKL